ncbi:MAG: universal stress protein [Chloroflexi bacterium]|nr:universal stress protein [Chloroflexota bacterium]
MPAAIHPLGILVGVVFLSAIAGILGWLFSARPAPQAYRVGRDSTRRNRIIVPLGDSTVSRQALECACDLASKRCAEIVLAKVIVIPMTRGLDAPLEDEEENGKRILAEAEVLAKRRGLTVLSRIVRHRSTLGAIKDLASETGAQTIVLGATPPRGWLSSGIGRSATRRMLGGSCEVVVAKTASP